MEYIERAISIEELKEAVKEMKSGKAPVLYGFPVEILDGVVNEERWYFSVRIASEIVECKFSYGGRANGLA